MFVHSGCYALNQRWEKPTRYLQLGPSVSAFFALFLKLNTWEFQGPRDHLPVAEGKGHSSLWVR